MPALSNRWRQNTQGQLSLPTICLAAKKWTTQKTTKAWIVEGAGDGFEFLLALLVQNGIPSIYFTFMIFSHKSFFVVEWEWIVSVFFFTIVSLLEEINAMEVIIISVKVYFKEFLPNVK